MKRIIAGLLLAPLIAIGGALLILIVMAVWQQPGWIWSADAWDFPLIMVLIFLAIAYAAELALGVPMLLAFRRWRVHKPWPFMLVGALCAAGVILLFPSGCGDDGEYSRNILGLLEIVSAAAAGVGGLGGLSFWGIAISNNRKFLHEGFVHMP